LKFIKILREPSFGLQIIPPLAKNSKAIGKHCVTQKSFELSGDALEKYTTALRIQCPWLEWMSSDKISVGSRNPCSKEDRNNFVPPPLSLLEMAKRPLCGKHIE
jgi:hypothetical protein